MKVSVENSVNELWISFNEVTYSKAFTSLIVAATKNESKVWIGTYGRLGGDNSMVSVSGHLKPEDARIIALALLKAADVAEGKEIS